MENTKAQRNNWFDVIKFVASFFVVCIHIPLTDGNFGIAVNAVARFAVPTFFAISGFYVFGTNATTVKRRLVKILIIYLVASAIYHIQSIIAYLVTDGLVGFLNYFSDVFFNVGKIKDYFLFNIPFSAVHLWYLLALIYVYLIWLVILKYSLGDKIILIIGMLTLLVNLVIGELLSLLGVVIDYIYIRNFAFTGLPFFIFGFLLRKYNHLFLKIKPFHLILAIAIGSCEAVLSRFLIGHNEVFIGSVLCCFSIILLAGKLKTVRLSEKYIAVFRSSTDVYVLHTLFSNFLSSLASVLPPVFEAVIRALMPCLAFAVCVAFSLLKSRIIARINRKKQQISA